MNIKEELYLEGICRNDQEVQMRVSQSCEIPNFSIDLRVELFLPEKKQTIRN